MLKLQYLPLFPQLGLYNPKKHREKVDKKQDSIVL